MSPEYKLLEDLPEAIQVIGKDLRCLYVNKAGRLQAGLDGDPVPGKFIKDIYAGADLTDLVFALERSMNENIVAELRIETHPPEGMLHFFDLRIQPLDNRVMILSKDVTEQEKIERLLIKEGVHQTSILAGMTENLILHKVVTDEHGMPIDLDHIEIAPIVNGMFSEAKKEIAESIKGELLAAIKTEKLDLVNRVIALHESVKLERFIPALGKWYEIRVFSPMPGQIASLVSDINERKLAEEKIQKVNEELEGRVKERTQELITALEREKSLNDLKSNFVSIASHQFRTPLTTILSSIRLIETYLDSNEAGKCPRHIARIKTSVGSLTEILDDILSVERLERGKLSPKMELFNLRTFVQNLVDDLAPICKSNQRILYEHTGSLEILSDKSILKNVLQNLLSNAIKYSESNVRITASIEERTATLLVADRGIGVPAKDQESLFGRFFRASNIGSIQGTGLGLHIVRHYVDLLDGAISFKSVENEGTTFSIGLPQIL